MGGAYLNEQMRGNHQGRNALQERTYLRIAVVLRAPPAVRRRAPQGRVQGRKARGRGRPSRPSAELRRLHKRFEELADKVLNGEIERGVGAVAGQS